MQTYREIILWSHTVTADGAVFTKEAIEGVVDSLNVAERAKPGIVNHDLSTIPFRKFVEARLIEESGKYGAEITMAFGEEHHLRSKDLPESEFVLFQWDDDPKLFMRIAQEQAANETKVTVDFGDFDGPEQYEVFRRELDATDGLASGNMMARQSVDPAPIIEFILTNWEALSTLAASGWFAGRATKFVTGVTDELLARSVGPTCDMIEAKLSDLRRLFMRTRGRVDEELSLCIVMSWDEIEVVLLVSVSSDSEDVRLHFEQLGGSLDQYSFILDQADSVVLSLRDGNTWKFEYAKLNDGNAIGTRDCADRTLEQLRAIGKKARTQDDE